MPNRQIPEESPRGTTRRLPPEYGRDPRLSDIEELIKQMKYQREALSPDQVGPISSGEPYRMDLSDIFPGVPAPVAPVPPPNAPARFPFENNR